MKRAANLRDFSKIIDVNARACKKIKNIIKKELTNAKHKIPSPRHKEKSNNPFLFTLKAEITFLE